VAVPFQRSPLNGFVSECYIPGPSPGFTSPTSREDRSPPHVAPSRIDGCARAACFVKAFASLFSASPVPPAEGAHESPSPCRCDGSWPLLCGRLRLAPGLASRPDLLSVRLPGTTPQGRLSSQGGHAHARRATSQRLPACTRGLSSRSRLSPCRGDSPGGRMRKRSLMTWACGPSKVEPRCSIPPTVFKQAITHESSRIFPRTHEIERSPKENIFRNFHRTSPIAHKRDPVLSTSTSRLSHHHRICADVPQGSTGHIQTYLAYIFVTLVLLLLFAR